MVILRADSACQTSPAKKLRKAGSESTAFEPCCLALDLMQISQGLQHDLSLKQFVGNVSAELSHASETENKQTVSVTHLLCCMAKGIKRKFDLPFT